MGRPRATCHFRHFRENGRSEQVRRVEGAELPPAPVGAGRNWKMESGDWDLPEK